MRKLLLLATVAVLSVSPVFAQVKAPNYKDVSKWKYWQCDFPVSPSVTPEHLTFHDDYSPIGETNSQKGDSPTTVMVFYKPVHVDVLDKEGLEKFMEVSRQQPWLLVHVSGSESKINLFEYQDGSWEFKNEQEAGAYLSEHYRLFG